MLSKLTKLFTGFGEDAGCVCSSAHSGRFEACGVKIRFVTIVIKRALER